MKRFAIFAIMITALAGLSPAGDRWYYIGTSHANELVYVDNQSIEYPEYRDARPGDYVNAWTKWAMPDRTVALHHIQFHRSTKHLRLLGYATYDASGKLVGSSSTAATTWDDVVPGSMGELLMNLLTAPNNDTAKPEPPPIKM